MKQAEFRRWLAAQGAIFVEGARHTKAYYLGRQSTLPRHPGKALPAPTRKAILKQLGLATRSDAP